MAPQARQIWGARPSAAPQGCANYQAKSQHAHPQRLKLPQVHRGSTGISILILDMIWEIQNRHSMLISFCYIRWCKWAKVSTPLEHNSERLQQCMLCNFINSPRNYLGSARNKLHGQHVDTHSQGRKTKGDYQKHSESQELPSKASSFRHTNRTCESSI